MLDRSFIRQIESLQQEGLPFCVATIVDARGGFPQIVGARAVFDADGLLHGTVGGGTLEAACQQRALELLSDEAAARTDFRRYKLQNDLGMSCGGEVAVFFELQRRELVWNVVIFGAGHVAQALSRFLVEFDCQVLCIDTRTEWLERLPRSDKLAGCRVDDYCEGVGRVAPGADVMLMTMGHSFDMAILRALEKRGVALGYLGVIGSRAKSAIVRRQLAADGLPREFIDRIVCPIGDRVGNNTPAEIAVAIVSQLLRLRHGG